MASGFIGNKQPQRRSSIRPSFSTEGGCARQLERYGWCNPITSTEGTFWLRTESRGAIHRAVPGRRYPSPRSVALLPITEVCCLGNAAVGWLSFSPLVSFARHTSMPPSNQTSSLDTHPPPSHPPSTHRKWLERQRLPNQRFNHPSIRPSISPLWRTRPKSDGQVQSSQESPGLNGPRSTEKNGPQSAAARLCPLRSAHIIHHACGGPPKLLLPSLPVF